MGKNKEFEKLYEQHAPELFRFCYFRLRNKESAQDIVAEAFVKYLQNQGDEIENPRPWLYRVCRNQIYDLVVKNNIENKTIPLAPESEEMISDENGIESIVFKSENLGLLKEKLKELDEQTSEIIVLKVWEDMTFIEISKIVDIKEDAVKKRFYRGINTLQELVK